MKSQHPMWTELVGFELAMLTESAEPHREPGLTARCGARLFARRYDRQVEAGVTPVIGSPLAVHHRRLTSDRERAELARALHLVLRDAAEGRDLLNPRIPVHGDAVRHAADAIGDVRARLRSRSPVRARGTARLRLLLADGRGPLYRTRAGSLAAAMRGVLAAL